MIALLGFTPILLATLGLLTLPKKYRHGWLTLISGSTVLLTFSFAGTHILESSISQWTLPIRGIYNGGLSFIVDNLNSPFLILLKISTFAAIVGLGRRPDKREVHGFLIFLADAAGTLGMVVDDIFYLLACWEFTLVPIFLLLGIWGKADRFYAAFKFFAFHILSSFLFLLFAIMLVSNYKADFGYSNSVISNLVQLDLSQQNTLLGLTFAQLAMYSFLLATAIRVALPPFHTWLPDTLLQSPASACILVLGVLIPLGGYSFSRIGIPLFGESIQLHHQAVTTLGIVALWYSAFVGFHQSGLSQSIAYLYISNAAISLLLLASHGLSDLRYSIFHHVVTSLSVGALAAMGGMLYSRVKSIQYSELGGVVYSMPRMAFCFGLCVGSLMCLPGLPGFIGYFTVLCETTLTRTEITLIVVGWFALVLAALRAFCKTLYQAPPSVEIKRMADFSVLEALTILPALSMIVFLGLAPHFLVQDPQKSTQENTQTASISAGVNNE